MLPLDGTWPYLRALFSKIKKTKLRDCKNETNNCISHSPIATYYLRQYFFYFFKIINIVCCDLKNHFHNTFIISKINGEKMFKHILAPHKAWAVHGPWHRLLLWHSRCEYSFKEVIHLENIMWMPCFRGNEEFEVHQMH